MSSIEQMKLNIRLRLGEPVEQHPSDGQLQLILNTQIQSYINELNLSAKTWAVEEVLLNVVPTVEDYALPVTNFGKPYQVKTVYPQNPAHIERSIDFFELQDLNYDWNLPLNFGNTFFNLDGSPHTALRMAFFRKSGQNAVYVRVLPIPQLSATYKILYHIGTFGDTQGLGTVPVLPQHHALIEIRSAVDALPMTEWGDDAAENAAKRKEYAAALGATGQRMEREFNEYIKTVTVGRRLSTRSLPYAID